MVYLMAGTVVSIVQMNLSGITEKIRQGHDFPCPCLFFNYQNNQLFGYHNLADESVVFILHYNRINSCRGIGEVDHF